MAQSFFFYDLETSGFDPKRQRVMQFAGQRTDLQLNPLGEPLNFMIKLTPEVTPSPEAILLTGITPQTTVDQGITERDAVKRIMEEAFTPDTIAVGFNNVEFDDEFIRYCAYRNFWDPYEWAYSEGRSRWDLLDVVRMVRALRPEGIKWPVDADGKATNTLVELTTANNLLHLKAHDAMSDVLATIAIAQLIHKRQPRIWQYLLDGRNKEAVGKLVSPSQPNPFIYTTGYIGQDTSFTSIVVAVGYGDNRKVITYDLRHDPRPFLDQTVAQLRETLYTKSADRSESFLPLKAYEIALNKCPVVAPYATLRDEDAKRLGIDPAQVLRNLELLQSSTLGAKLEKVFARSGTFPKADDVDAALYDGFIAAQSDKSAMLQIRRSTTSGLAGLQPKFADPRLGELFLRYKGRNAPETLTPEERMEWESYVEARRAADLPELKSIIDKINKDDPDNGTLLVSIKSWAGL